MRKIISCVAAGLAIASSISATAGERQTVGNVKELKPGQCAASSYVYEQGELLKMPTNVTKVCTLIKGRSVWLTVDTKDLEELSY